MGQTREQANALGRARAKLQLLQASYKIIADILNNLRHRLDYTAATVREQRACALVIGTLEGRATRLSRQIGVAQATVNDLKAQQFAYVYGGGGKMADHRVITLDTVKKIADFFEDWRKKHGVEPEFVFIDEVTSFKDIDFGEIEARIMGRTATGAAGHPKWFWPDAGSVTGRFSKEPEPQEIKRHTGPFADDPPEFFDPQSSDRREPRPTLYLNLLDRVKKVRDLRNIQVLDGNRRTSDYMRGIANGLELAVSLLEARPPEYDHAKVADPNPVPDDEPRLGLATTVALLQELQARINMHGFGDYRPVDSVD